MPHSARETIGQPIKNQQILNEHKICHAIVQRNTKDMFPISEELKPMTQSGTKHAVSVEGTVRRSVGNLGATPTNDTEICKSEQKDAHVTGAQDGKNSCAPRAKGPQCSLLFLLGSHSHGEGGSGDRVGVRKGRSVWPPPSKLEAV